MRLPKVIPLGRCLTVFLASAVIAVILGTACSCAGQARRIAVAEKPWKVKVGPNACDLTDDDDGKSSAQKIAVSKGNNKHTIEWHSHDGVKHLYIVFHVPHRPTDCQKPFDALQDLGEEDSGKNELFLLSEDPTTHKVSSGAVSNGFACPCTLSDAECDDIDPKNLKPGQFKYDQYLQTNNGIFLFCDGWIIIKP